jgi:hypothetical protein
MTQKSTLPKRVWLAAGFAVLNVIMYGCLTKFWIGGSSFLPLIAVNGPNNAFVFAFLVNIGVMIGAFVAALIHKEFLFRLPKKTNLTKLIVGGFLIGVGITLCPGTCTTAFVTGLPMLSLASVLSIIGIVLGAFVAFRIVMKQAWGGK